MTAREALRLATRGGASLLGRDDLGSLEPGKCADFAVWSLDRLELSGAADPVAGLVFSAPHRPEQVYVGGEPVAAGGGLVHADEFEIAREHRAQATRFRG
jgi:cytosine/adenosine deaminase-related metal-dependent hydrolase